MFLFCLAPTPVLVLGGIWPTIRYVQLHYHMPLNFTYYLFIPLTPKYRSVVVSVNINTSVIISDRMDLDAYSNVNNNDTNDKEGVMFALTVLRFLNDTADKMMVEAANDPERSGIIKKEVFLLSRVLALPFSSIATPALPPQQPQVSNNSLGSGNGEIISFLFAVFMF